MQGRGGAGLEVEPESLRSSQSCTGPVSTVQPEEVHASQLSFVRTRHSRCWGSPGSARELTKEGESIHARNMNRFSAEEHQWDAVPDGIAN